MSVYSDNWDYIESEICRIWKCLCEEYNTTVENTPLKIMNLNEYVIESAKNTIDMKLSTEETEKYMEMVVRDLMGARSNSLFYTEFDYSFNNDSCHVNVLGVFVIRESLDKWIKYDDINELKMKMPTIEIFLRHEMGHVLMTRAIFDGCTSDEWEKYHNTIKQTRDEQIREFIKKGEDYEHPLNYYTLMDESMANKAVGISLEIIEMANDILTS